MFVNFEPEFTYAKQFWRVDFEFRTQKTDGFLLEHKAILHQKSKNIADVILSKSRIMLKIFDVGSPSNNVTLTLRSQQGKYFFN